MTNYRMQDSMPSATILSKNPRTSSLDELRIYNENTIFLNDGIEFQIRLFNPLTEKIGVKIGLNERFSESILVLNPGQDVILDRFIDDQKKMLFETYLYDSDNKQSQKAIVNNGNVTIQFFKEKINNPIWISNTIYYPERTIYGSPNQFDNIVYNSNSAGKPYNISTNITSTNIIGNSTYTCSTDSLQFKNDEPKTRSKKLKETGRVEKGDKSEQNFKTIQIQFEPFYFHKIDYNLKPTSENENLNIQIREYCTSCSYRIRNKKYNYCPKCGTKL